jgi:cell division protein ZapA (FtsZ GTPase activity inhibitor)
MDNLIAATILIGDRNYRIKVEPKDEELVRKTTKAINDKIIEFKTNFAGKDMQDYIAMVLIWFATEQGTVAAADLDKGNISDRLDSIERLLDGQPV